MQGNGVAESVVSPVLAIAVAAFAMLPHRERLPDGVNLGHLTHLVVGYPFPLSLARKTTLPSAPAIFLAETGLIDPVIFRAVAVIGVAGCNQSSHPDNCASQGK